MGLPPVRANAKLICPVATMPGPGSGALVAVAAHHAPGVGMSSEHRRCWPKVPCSDIYDQPEPSAIGVSDFFRSVVSGRIDRNWTRPRFWRSQPLTCLSLGWGLPTETPNDCLGTQEGILVQWTEVSRQRESVQSSRNGKTPEDF